MICSPVALHLLPGPIFLRQDSAGALILDEYGIGILAKEIEGDAEEEALKAQAVLIRTSIYKSIQRNFSVLFVTFYGHIRARPIVLCQTASAIQQNRNHIRK